MKTVMRNFALSLLSVAGVLAGMQASAQTANGPISGAIFTTAVDCTIVNGNIYASKGDVYLDGGPAKPGAAALPASTKFYVQVTDPSGGQVLGSSLYNPVNKMPLVTTTNGDVSSCLHLQEIVSLPDGTAGYMDSRNYGGEYKVWVSTSLLFDNQYTKTDNFKVGASVVPPSSTSGTIKIYKFYDADANGRWSDGDQWLPSDRWSPGWKVDIMGYGPNLTTFGPDGASYAAYATYDGLPLTDAGASSETYVVREYQPQPVIGTQWYSTTPLAMSTTPPYLNQFDVTLSPTSSIGSVTFGNVCTGKGGGLTIGFWSNKKGATAINNAQITGLDPGSKGVFAGLGSLNLVNAQGNYVSFADIPTFDYWLLNATAKNMAYMLSVQYAAMYLNMNVNSSSPSTFGLSLIYAAGVPGAMSSGFASVNTVMAAAKQTLEENPLTLNGDASTADIRRKQEAIKSALDRANNDLGFVQKQPCAATF